MKNIILVILILAQSVLCNTDQRLSSNLISLMFLGDFNVAYEKKFKPDVAWVTTYHIGKSSDTFFDESGTMMRLSFGYRFFRPMEKEKRQFIEFKLAGLSDFSDVGSLKTRTTYLLFDVYGGEQIDFNESIFYEYKIGFMRNLSSSSKYYPAIGLNIGTYL